MPVTVKRTMKYSRWIICAISLALGLPAGLFFLSSTGKEQHRASAAPDLALLPALEAGNPPAPAPEKPARAAPTLKPPALGKGDTIGIVAPASSMDQAGASRAMANLTRRGYKVRLSKGYLEARGYLAGTDKARAAEFNAFFADPAIKAILCLRGGYGSPRILDRLDYELIRKNPKILIGYSDITALLNGIHSKTGLVVFHGPMAKEFSLGKGLTPYTEKYFWPAFTPSSRLFADWGGPGPRGRAHLRTIRGGQAEGVLVGGNLSVLVSTIGTPYEARAEDCILFLEDVSEKPFRIDRMLNQLRLSGKLGQYKGVLLGSFTGCLPLRQAGRIGLLDVFDHYFADLGVPVLSGYAAGHQPDQATLPFGIRVHLDATEKILSFIEAGVEEQQ
jgi:muramoyltetrapeptide carboxypeptidase